MAKKKPIPKIGDSLTNHERLKKKIAAMEKLMIAIRKDIGKSSNFPGDWTKNREI